MQLFMKGNLYVTNSFKSYRGYKAFDIDTVGTLTYQLNYPLFAALIEC